MTMGTSDWANIIYGAILFWCGFGWREVRERFSKKRWSCSYCKSANKKFVISVNQPTVRNDIIKGHLRRSHGVTV